MGPPIIEGAVLEFNVDESYFESSEIRNPFLSRLPKKEEPKPPAPAAADIPQRPAISIQPVEQPGRGERKSPPPVEIPLPALNVTGLIWNTDRPQAIVNSQIVDVGDTILDARIIAITKTGIDVLFNGKKFFIRP